MTREEAIEVLQKSTDNTIEMTIREWEEFDKKVAEAVDMAIEALSVDVIEFDFNKHQPRVRNKVYDEHGFVKVVRCKDCRHGQYDATHYFCAEHHHKVYEDDYCSSGQRLSNFGEEDENHCQWGKEKNEN